MPFKKHDRQYDLVVLGATGNVIYSPSKPVPHPFAGYTGALTTEHIMKSFPKDLKWAVAGRSPDKLQQLVSECHTKALDGVQPGTDSHPSSNPTLTASKEIEVCNANDEEL